jgi:hypothetical protein
MLIHVIFHVNIIIFLNTSKKRQKSEQEKTLILIFNDFLVYIFLQFQESVWISWKENLPKLIVYPC